MGAGRRVGVKAILFTLAHFPDQVEQLALQCMRVGNLKGSIPILDQAVLRANAIVLFNQIAISRQLDEMRIPGLFWSVGAL